MPFEYDDIKPMKAGLLDEGDDYVETSAFEEWREAIVNTVRLLGECFADVARSVGGHLKERIRKIMPERPKERKGGTSALEDWRSAPSLDLVLEDIYLYYYGKGMRVIFLDQFFNLITMAFVVYFSLTLLYCVRWHRLLKGSGEELEKLGIWDVVRPHGLLQMHWFLWLCLIGFSVLWLWKMLWLFLQVPQLRRTQRIYNDLLEIDDSDLSTCTFDEVISRLRVLQKMHPIRSSDARCVLGPLEVSARVMRRQNYMIAMFHKDILNLRVPGPFGGVVIGPDVLLSRTLEWNMWFCIASYFFDENHQVRQRFIQAGQRKTLVAELRKRFLLVGLINFVLTPFICLFLVVYFVFRYGEELYKNPGTIGTRQYTLFAKWTFREYNELPHLFSTRLSQSYRKAARYLSQFHNWYIASTARFVSFVAGSVTVVLLLASVMNEELLMHFTVSRGRSVIWYLGLFTALLHLARAFVPDENDSSDANRLMEQVIEHTRYYPPHWKDILHSARVSSEFGQFFQFKLLIFIHELLGFLVTPFMLWFSLAPSSEQIVDFFRDGTIHIDGIGHVCTAAFFEMRRHCTHDVQQDGQQGTSTMSQKDYWQQWEMVLDKANGPEEEDEPGHITIDMSSAAVNNKPLINSDDD